MPIAATFPIELIRDAVTLQAGRHVHGKVVVRLGPSSGDGAEAAVFAEKRACGLARGGVTLEAH